MSRKLGGLGKGLDSLFAENGMEDWNKTPDPTDITALRISDIEPDRFQPRKTFNEEALASLSASIAEHGVLQPIVVRSAARPEDDEKTKTLLAGKYRIISGERRWRAAKMAGLTDIPCVVKELSDTEASAVMLVENLQREDLNPVEVAKGLKRLIEDYGLTQEETAKAVGISRPNLANSLRLLNLPENALDFLSAGDISAGHARALLPLEKEEAINEALDVVLAKQLSVRETEKFVKNLLKKKDSVQPIPCKDPDTAVYMDTLAEKVASHLGRKAHFKANSRKKGAGKLEIEYYSNQDLEALLTLICGNDIFKE